MSRLDRMRKPRRGADLSEEVRPTRSGGTAAPRLSTAQQFQRSVGNQAALQILSQKTPKDSAGSGSGSAAPQPAPDLQPAQPPSKSPAPVKGAPAGPKVTQIGPVRAPSTPPEMKADRIPPRVDTRVQLSLSGVVDASAPVTLSIETGPKSDPGYGAASFGGNPTLDVVTTGDVTVKLRGDQQTEPGKAGHLKLVARQGGRVLGTSAGFSVAAIPQNHSIKFRRMMTGSYRGIMVDEAWESDSLNRQDLDQAAIAERVQHDVKGIKASDLVPGTSCYKRADKTDQDKHALLAAQIKGPLTDIVQQTHMFREDRTGAVNIPMKNSGYTIEHIVQKKGEGLEVVTSKKGAATTAKDPNAKCKSGPIASDAGDGEVKPVSQDL